MLPSAVLGAPLRGAILEASLAVLQSPSDIEWMASHPLLGATASFVLTFAVGGILLATAPEYVDRIQDRIDDDPAKCLAWGLSVVLGFVAVSYVLALTLLGLVLAVPLVFVLWLLVVLGNALAFIAVVGTVVESKWLALLGGAATMFVLGLVPAIGLLVGLLIGLFGIGAIYAEHHD